MTVPEPQLTPEPRPPFQFRPESETSTPKPDLRWYQYSLKSLFLATIATAVFFAVGCTCGYVAAMLVLAAFEILLGLKEYRPHRVHLAAGILLAAVALQVLASQESEVLWVPASTVLAAFTVRYFATRFTKQPGRLTHHAVGLLGCLVGAITGSIGSAAIFEPSIFNRDFDVTWAGAVISGFILAAIVEFWAAVIAA
jgi:hypothetical protein